MNAFAKADADLHADPNLSVELTYKPKDAPMVRGVRGILMAPVEPIAAGFGGRAPGAIAKREQLSLPKSSLPCRPQDGDQIQFTGRLQLDQDIRTVDGKVEENSEGSTWLLTLTRAKINRT